MSKWKLVAAAFCVALWAAPASAQRADDMKSGQGGGQHPCASDAQSICSEFIPDRAKVASCLFKNKTRISSACSAAIGGGKSGKGSGKKKSKGKKSKKHKRH